MKHIRRWKSAVYLKSTFRKSTLPVKDSRGICLPPVREMVGSKVMYSKTRAPALIPLTIWARTHIIYNILIDSQKWIKRENDFFSPTTQYTTSITCPNRMEMLARDLQKTERGEVSEQSVEVIRDKREAAVIRLTFELFARPQEMTWGHLGSCRYTPLGIHRQKWCPGLNLMREKLEKSVQTSYEYYLSVNPHVCHSQFRTMLESPWNTAIPLPRASFIRADFSTSVAYALRQTEWIGWFGRNS